MTVLSVPCTALLRKQIVASGFVDDSWYRARYRDVAMVGMDPVEHYLRIGALIGRSPGPLFDGPRYLREYPDIAASGKNPLLHYLQHGIREGRIRHPLERVPVGDPAEHLESLANATLDGAPKRMFAGFDFDAQEEFLGCIAKLVGDSEACKVSVIMPTYNRGGMIGTAIESVLAQTHPSWELLIVDDGSSDNTFDVVGSFAADSRIRIFRQHHRGVSAARNTGLANAEGDWIFYLDSDNRWAPDFLRSMVVYLKHVGRRCGYSAIAVQDDDGAVAGYRGEPFDWNECIKGNYVDLNAFCHDRTLYQLNGPFDESLRRMVDWDLILRYTKAESPAYAPFVGCYYRNSNADTSRISVSQPLAYRSVVQAKNRLEDPTPEAIATDLRLRFAIKIPAPFEKRQEWGDFHFAESLKTSLERLGHTVVIDFLGNWYDRPVSHDQVVLVLRGLTAYEPRPGQINILWNISHPDQVAYDEYDAYDIAYVASLSYPRLLNQIVSRPVRPLLQCTDTDRFCLTSAAAANEDAIFVGNSRNEYRRIVRWAVESGARVKVYGSRWQQFIDEDRIAGENIDNRLLGEHYASAKAVLNDHWDSMRDFGFVSNRVFDVLAAGGRLISDPVPAISKIFTNGVYEVDSAESLSRALLEVDSTDGRPDRGLASDVARQHSFDSRAMQICNDILVFLGLPIMHAGNDGAAELRFSPEPTRVGVLMQKGRYGPTSSGYIRLLAPLTTDEALGKVEIVVLDGVDDPAGEECEAWVVQRTAIGDPHAAEALVDRLQQRGAALFVDIDDALALLDPSHPEADDYRVKDTSLRYLMGEARQVWFSTEHLQSVYPEVGARGRVFRNNLDPRLWRNYRKRRRSVGSSDMMELLYMGTATHDADFALLLPALDRLHEAHPGRFRLTVIGALRRPPDREWLQVTTPRGNQGNYARFVRWLALQGPFDVGLAPLADTPFNTCKSDIKFLDYSALGIATVLSDSPAYGGLAGRGLAFACGNTADAWFEVLQGILVGELDVDAIASRAWDHLWNERTVQAEPLMQAIASATSCETR